MPNYRLGLLLLIGVMALPSLATGQREEFVPVIIAKQDLPRGLLLTEELVLGEDAVLAVAFYPPDALPATALQSLEEAIGYVLRTDVPLENPIFRHFLFPHPAQHPFASAPYPIAPSGYRVAREYGVFREITLDQLERVRAPALLAAGDRVDLFFTTQVGGALQDESAVVVESLIVAQVSEAYITLSVSEEQQSALQALLPLDVPLTLVLRGRADLDRIEAVNWDYLTTREFNPILVPDGANLSQVGR